MPAVWLSTVVSSFDSPKRGVWLIAGEVLEFSSQDSLLAFLDFCQASIRCAHGVVLVRDPVGRGCSWSWFIFPTVLVEPGRGVLGFLWVAGWIIPVTCGSSDQGFLVHDLQCFQVCLVCCFLAFLQR